MRWSRARGRECARSRRAPAGPGDARDALALASPAETGPGAPARASPVSSVLRQCTQFRT